jgi:hypothetical protein
MGVDLIGRPPRFDAVGAVSVDQGSGAWDSQGMLRGTWSGVTRLTSLTWSFRMFRCWAWGPGVCMTHVGDGPHM